MIICSRQGPLKVGLSFDWLVRSFEVCITGYKGRISAFLTPWRETHKMWGLKTQAGNLQPSGEVT